MACFFEHRKILSASMVATLLGLVLCLRYSMNLRSAELPGEGLKQFSVTKATTPVQLTPSGVPKIIHFIYRDTSVLMPYRDAFETCTKFNKDWLIVLWTDEAVNKFMLRDFPDRMKAYAAFPHKIQRADAIRYLILYKFGGIYMDLDMHCHQPLLPVLSPHGCFIDKERQHQTTFVHGKPYSAMNSAMGCSPGHPFFRKVVDFVFHPDRVKQHFVFPYTIFTTTGPAMLTGIFDQWQASKSQPAVTMLSESYFSPKINPRSGIYGSCRSMTGNAAKQPSGPISDRDRVCWELKRMGFEKSDDLFITNLTVAVHQFTHLGYHDQKISTFNLTKDFPQVKSYFHIANYSL